MSTGIDELEARDFDALRIPGVTTVHAGLHHQSDRPRQPHGKRTIDVLARVPGVQLSAIFSPEHGITGASDSANIASFKDGATGVPIYSVFGDSDAKRRPHARCSP